jgi:hypothetical protein
MADEVLPIKQGDTIYFYDTTVGDVASYSWQFTGGTPSTSTSPNEYVTFNGTNEGGYSVSFNVTSPSGITVGITKDNIISVSPETISSAFTLGSSSRLMSQQQTYTSGATASSGIANYAWTIPGLGSTSGSNKTSVSYTANDWYSISGTYLGAVNSSYLATSTLSITSNVPNTSSTNQNVTYYKMGPAERYDLDDVGLTGPYYTPTISTSNSGNLGIGGSSIVVKIDQSSSWSGMKFDNQYTHSSDEVLYFYPNTVDVSGGSSATPIRTRIILNKSQLDIEGASYTETPIEFTSGSYILPSGILNIFDYTFYITDYTTTSPNALTNLINERGWDQDSVAELLKNTYYKSASSKYIETVKSSSIYGQELLKNATYGYDWTGGYDVSSPTSLTGVIVPSSKFFDDYLGTSGEVSVSLYIDVYDESTTLLDSLRSDISVAGATGNSPDGYLVTAQDSVYGSLRGIAWYLQSTISLSNFSDNIIIESSTKFIPDYSNSNHNFYGIRVSIIDPYISAYDANIGWIEIYWDPTYIDQLPGIGAQDLDVSFANSPVNTNSFSGLPEKIGNFTSPQSTKRGWSLGGAVA